MSAESTLYAALSGHAPLTAIVGARIYPNAMPEEGAYPAVVYTRAGTEPVTTIDGARHAEFTRMQISTWANTRTAADAAGDAIEGALLAARELPEGRQGVFDAEIGLYATLIDVTLFVA